MNSAVLWRATRAYSFPASAVPVLLGTALAARGYAFPGHSRFDALTFSLTLLGALLAHAGANVLKTTSTMSTAWTRGLSTAAAS